MYFVYWLGILLWGISASSIATLAKKCPNKNLGNLILPQRLRSRQQKLDG